MYLVHAMLGILYTEQMLVLLNKNDGGITMSIAKVTEIITSSNKSFEDAIQTGVTRASKTLDNITGAWVSDQSVKVDNGKVSEYRVNMKLTFILND